MITKGMLFGSLASLFFFHGNAITKANAQVSSPASAQPSPSSAVPSVYAAVIDLSKTIDSHIAAAKKQAEAKKKPLLVIVGEQHRDSLSSLYVDIFALRSSANRGIKDYYDESDPAYLAQIRTKPLEARNMNGDFTVPLAEKGLGMTVHPMDKPGINGDYGLTLEGIAEREGYMEHQILSGNKDAIVVTGIDHVKFFNQSQALRKRYHIVALIPTAEVRSDPHNDTPMGKFLRDRDTYNATSSDVLRLATPPMLSSIPIRATFEFLLGENFSQFEDALRAGNNNNNPDASGKTSTAPDPANASLVTTPNSPLDQSMANACKGAAQNKSDAKTYSGDNPYEQGMRKRCNFTTGVLAP